MCDEFGRGESVGELELLTEARRVMSVHAVRDTELAKLPVCASHLWCAKSHFLPSFPLCSQPFSPLPPLRSWVSSHGGAEGHICARGARH